MGRISLSNASYSNQDSVIDKFYFIIKTLALQKTLLKGKTKRQAADWKKISANYISNKE